MNVTKRSMHLHFVHKKLQIITHDLWEHNHDATRIRRWTPFVGEVWQYWSQMNHEENRMPSQHHVHWSSLNYSHISLDVSQLQWYTAYFTRLPHKTKIPKEKRPPLVLHTLIPCTCTHVYRLREFSKPAAKMLTKFLWPTTFQPATRSHGCHSRLGTWMPLSVSHQ